MINHKIPVSVVIATKNEAANMARCLLALEAFDEIVVVDSNSVDGTKEAAKSFDVRIENFSWNGSYPKKRQWILDNIPLKHDFVFFVDADEEVTPALCDEMRGLNFRCAGYFVKGTYVMDGKPLKFGLKNNKLALINKHYIEFPVVDDLDVSGMGEIEGHYQPVLKRAAKGMALGQVKTPLKHHAMEDTKRWEQRHRDYATWQAGVLKKKALPQEQNAQRAFLKKIFYTLPFRGLAAFAHSYILKGGVLDGRAGFVHAKNRYNYYQAF